MEKKIKERRYNHLVNEKSPYLLKHAENPVDWYPWGDEAFNKALKEDKPVFLSIGYSTCHWCHVMERESYADSEAGKLMNEVFVSIKVDREERPDIDNIYISVCQIMLGGGCGWPLNIIMTSDKKPFYAATYIPKTGRFGRYGMIELIPRIKELWQNKRDEILSTANRITNALDSFSGDSTGRELNETNFDKAYEQLSSTFDEEYGGVGTAPKFPSPHTLLFLLRHWKRTGNSRSLFMVEKTLQKMGQGGMYDHIGFGFHRYSTDRQWLVPHFEKMLYDQALLAMAYTEAFQVTRKGLYGKTAKDIFTYVLRDMTSSEGLFYSAEDADSEGEEGKFYLWSKDEIEDVLSKEEAELVKKVFNIEKEGNFVDQMEQCKIGKNIFYLQNPLKIIAPEINIPKNDLELQIEKVRKKLYLVRKKRIHPYKDDKVLTDWNGLMISALAKGAQTFDNPVYEKAARRAADGILKKMRLPNGRLLHRYRAGEAAIPAMVNDYAYLIQGLLDLYEASFEILYLNAAIGLTEDFINHFWDKQNGGFFFSPDDNEKVLVSRKDFNDDALPSGNSVSMLNLLRLGRITARPEYEQKASKIGRLAANQADQYPAAYTQLFIALDFGIGPSCEVVISGNKDSNDTKEMIKAIQSHFIPNKVILLHSVEQNSPDIIPIAKFTGNLVKPNDRATAYICHNYNCKLPTADINEMLGFLDIRKPSYPLS